MTIKGLNELKKRHAENACFKLSIKDFSGKRVAIDANLWMKKNMSIARNKIIDMTDLKNDEINNQDIRREWFLTLIKFVIKWLSYNITPIFVFDGIPRKEKQKTIDDRHEKQSAVKYKIDAFYAMLKDKNAPSSIIDDLKKTLKSYNHISIEERELFLMILKGIGIPCLKSVHDAEQLCSLLCIDGKVAAVYSDDTDNYAFGCPLLITGFSQSYTYDQYGNAVPDVNCVRLDKILEGLNLTYNTFIDLCIMCGCDYNKNIPGYAAIKSYNLLKKYGSIDKLPRTIDILCLDHINCRKIFKYIPHKSFIDDDTEIIFDVNKEAIITARDFLEIVSIGGQIKFIIDAFKCLENSSDGTIENLNLRTSYKYAPLIFLKVDTNKS